MNRDNFFIVVCLLALVILYLVSRPTTNEHSRQDILRSIAITHRPRVIYFHANGYVCDHIGPELQKTVAAYGHTIDFQSVDVKDPNNVQLLNDFQIAAVQRGCGGFIPTTYIFNEKGEQVFMGSGYIDQSSLDYMLRNIHPKTVTKSSGTEHHKSEKKRHTIPFDKNIG